MAFNVKTYTSEEELGEAIQANVQTLTSEEALAEALDLIPDPNDILTVVAKGGFFTVISNPQIIFTSLKVVAKGGFFTVILETL